MTWPDGSESEGVPDIKGLGDRYGDYIQVSICVDCHKVQDLASTQTILRAAP